MAAISFHYQCYKAMIHLMMPLSHCQAGSWLRLQLPVVVHTGNSYAVLYKSMITYIFHAEMKIFIVPN